MCLVGVASHASAMDYTWVYGHQFPLGFYNYVEGLLMSDSERKALLGGPANPYTGEHPYSQLMRQWNEQCGQKMMSLKKSQASCKTAVTNFQLNGLELCDDIASGRSIDYSLSIGHPLLGGTVTFSAPTHSYTACAEKTNVKAEGLKRECDSNFDLAIQESRECIGATGW